MFAFILSLRTIWGRTVFDLQLKEIFFHPRKLHAQKVLPFRQVFAIRVSPVVLGRSLTESWAVTILPSNSNCEHIISELARSLKILEKQEEKKEEHYLVTTRLEIVGLLKSLRENSITLDDELNEQTAWNIGKRLARIIGVSLLDKWGCPKY